jgi:Ca2+-binding EF-hand superfamily protein
VSIAGGPIDHQARFMRYSDGGGIMGRGAAMRLIFALMDSDSDGTVSLQEFQAAHEKIFKAMDTDKDGTLTLEEIQAFMRGTGKSAREENEHEHE